MTPKSMPKSARPSNRMRHGLRSRVWFDDMRMEAHDLISRLAAPASSCPLVQSAASDVADAMLHLREVRRRMMSITSPPPDAEDGRNAPPDVDDELLHVMQMMQAHADDLRTTEDYERKVVSRLKRAITRLDYVILEARRREKELIDHDATMCSRMDLFTLR